MFCNTDNGISMTYFYFNRYRYVAYNTLNALLSKLKVGMSS